MTESNADIIIGNLNAFFIIYPLFKILSLQTSILKGLCQGSFSKFFISGFLKLKLLVDIF